MKPRSIAWAVIGAMGFTTPAFATPVGTSTVIAELEKQDANSIQSAIVNGKPMITGRLLSAGFTAVMDECDEAAAACEKINYKTCHNSVNVSRLDMLEIANAYNLRTFSGTAFVRTTESIGDVICVKHEAAFPGDQSFGRHLVTDWLEVIADFQHHIEEELSDRQIRSTATPSP